MCGNCCTCSCHARDKRIKEIEAELRGFDGLMINPDDPYLKTVVEIENALIKELEELGGSLQDQETW